MIPQLTGFGILFGLALFVLPTLSAVLTNVAWYIALVPTPVTLLVALPSAWSYLSCARSRPQAAGNRFGGFPTLLTGQATTEGRTLVTETPGPTSVEFQILFNDAGTPEPLAEAIVGVSRGHQLLWRRRETCSSWTSGFGKSSTGRC